MNQASDHASASDKTVAIAEYQHRDWQGQAIALPVGKVVCIGQNYQDHIQEMNSKTAPQALFFIKPATALRPLAPAFVIPGEHGAVHNETEIAVLIQQPLSKATQAEVQAAIWGYSLALDLTLRDVQAELKKLGRPWEIAKGFDGACPTAGFVPAALVAEPQQLQFSLQVNNEVRQQGDARLMIRSISQMLVEMSQWFTLQPGDIVLTGTPAGVGPLQHQDQLQLTLSPWLDVLTTVHQTV
ncbi:fumarylacetoacetate hydrolase family protein [Rheinheimera riviphila]|uniref:Fumarylacetoacetate hydrolase family protein n=1 Tax=Rheinheimera riviphila TaxID=1834037 RepID=A0A437R1N9_9GAMM|nr:fumarylacetoacetate hydrolase family protein [Rheinheimera riviphila]RVU40642.1 fumarylacetoacetate hydrolase family protein [Rheinheimera riviphila]